MKDGLDESCLDFTLYVFFSFFKRPPTVPPPQFVTASSSYGSTPPSSVAVADGALDVVPADVEVILFCNNCNSAV